MPSQDPLSEAIIGAAFRVSNTLGAGFVEKVYENALAHELAKAGFTALQQHAIQVTYDGIPVGEFIADLVVEGRIVIELKAVKALEDAHMAQCINYLKATALHTCLLINFGRPHIEVRRVVL
ncbi:MAG: hypothetical protein H6Q00_850 [Holophagaceae bacterium]|nr:hypothetical protein [Holophagaceae bacterium]